MTMRPRPDSRLSRVTGDPVVRRLAAGATALAVALIVCLVVPQQAQAAGRSATPVATGNDGLTATKTLSRTFYPGGGEEKTVDNDVTVTLDRHTNIQANERIHVTWSGAHPTGARSVNPFGNAGMQQEYPVLIMECRGTPDQVTPQTCWTDNFQERTASAAYDNAPGNVTGDSAVWLDDAQNKPGVDDQRVSGLTAAQQAALPSNDCTYGPGTAAHITPFVAASGAVFDNCSNSDMAPEQTAGAGNGSTPPQEISAFTDSHGDGAADFEVRTDAENASLGCSQSVACSVVVIPIEGLSCTQATQTNCNSAGNYDPGTYYDGATGGALAVSSQLWWSPSNWNQRFAFPITIAPPPSVCSLSSAAGSPVPFYGSELLSQAALQWTPAYCLNRSRFNWQDNVMADDAAFSLMQAGTATAAEVSSRVEGDQEVAYAPTAITGWGVAFDIDTPTGGQQTSLKLNARLLAKLLTESYSGGDLGVQRPGLEKNPYSLNLDPEFQALNPGLDKRHWSEAAATMLAISNSSAVMKQVTSYIAEDKDAMAFVHGQPDPWGMTVNPAYKDVQLPVSTWPLLDTWVPTTSDECHKANQTAYMPLIASPVSTLRLVSRAMLYNWPNVSTVCNTDNSTDPPTYAIGRVGVQGIGSRFMLGLVDLGDAARYDLPLASLETTSGAFVAPSATSLAAAVKVAKPDKKNKPFLLDELTLRRASDAYPGTMVVYTAAKTTALAKADAKHVAQFIQVSLSEGQVPGRGNGQLPQGYLPITDSGVTKALYQAGMTARKAILAQKQPKAPTTPAASAPPSGTATTPKVAPPPTAPSAAVPAVAAPSAAAAPVATSTTAADPVVKTAAVSSNLGGGMLPVLLFVGLAALMASLLARVALLVRGVR